MTAETPLELRFQPWQFDRWLGRHGGHSGGATIAEMMRGGFDTSDLSRNQNDVCTLTLHRAPKKVGKARWRPAFATNNEQVRAVLTEAGRKFAAHAGATALDWQGLNRVCTKKVFERAFDSLPEHEKESVLNFQRAVRHAGSYMGYLAGIVHFYWREALDSVEVAEVMDATPTQVRQAAFRLARTARELGFETCARHQTAGMKRNRRAQMEARRRTLRRKLYGNPEFDETVQCWICKVNPKKPGNKWHCEPCAASEAQSARRRYRLAHGLPLRRHLRAKHAKAYVWPNG